MPTLNLYLNEKLVGSVNYIAASANKDAYLKMKIDHLSKLYAQEIEDSCCRPVFYIENVQSKMNSEHFKINDHDEKKIHTRAYVHRLHVVHQESDLSASMRTDQSEAAG